MFSLSGKDWILDPMTLFFAFLGFMGCHLRLPKCTFCFFVLLKNLTWNWKTYCHFIENGLSSPNYDFWVKGLDLYILGYIRFRSDCGDSQVGLSFLKPSCWEAPKMIEKCQRLLEWILEQFPIAMLDGLWFWKYKKAMPNSKVFIWGPHSLNWKNVRLSWWWLKQYVSKVAGLKSNIDTKKLPCLKGELPFPRPIIWGPRAISELGGVITWVMWCRILFIPKHHMEVTYPYSIRPNSPL